MAGWCIDENLCVGCVLCSDQLPRLFKYDRARQEAVVNSVDLGTEERAAAVKVAAACPVDAISYRTVPRAGPLLETTSC